MPTVIPVRMHFNAQDLWFNPRQTGAVAGDHVVITTERGTEFGLVTADPFEVTKEEVKGSELKPVLRVATPEDVERAEELARRGEEAMPVFRRLVKESELDMKPVGVEFLFGGEKAVFYFAAEDRVDFRDLVRDLASHFKQRVDMRQIGVRDEARLVGGYAPCGQELCCVRFGGEFEPVSIRMAKEQDLPLNSSKISGVCGRLMCCLRYEFEAYRDFKQRAPKRNALIDTPLGKAKIVEYNTPRETLTLRLENGKSFTVALKDMSCSEGCCKRAAEQNIPLRPDTVTREALEELGTPDIIMQLAELDRANGVDTYVLDDSLLESRRTPRRRSSAGAPASKEDEAPAREGKRSRGQKSAEKDRTPDGRTPRRRSNAAGAPEEAPAPTRRQRKGPQPAPVPEAAAPVADEAPAEQRRQPRGGGMRPRRQGKAPQAAGEQQTGKPARGKEQVGKDAQQASGARNDGQQRRTRRRHSAESVPQNTGEQQARDRRGGNQQGEATAQGQQRQQRTRRERSGQPAGEQQAQQPARHERAAQPSGEQQAPQEHKTRSRRQHHSAQQAPDAARSAKPEGGTPQPAEGQRTPRRRRPGDRGGSDAPAASQE